MDQPRCDREERCELAFEVKARKKSTVAKASCAVCEFSCVVNKGGISDGRQTQKVSKKISPEYVETLFRGAAPAGLSLNEVAHKTEYFARVPEAFIELQEGSIVSQESPVEGIIE